MIETTDALHEAVVAEALSGLSSTPKTLGPWLFYDERGSELFEQITELPEYYLTRAERSIFAAEAAEIIAQVGSAITVAELGAGNASKTGLLLEAATRLQPGLLYQPIDISASSLDSADESLTTRIPGLRVHPQVANYITEPYRIERPRDHTILALYIGSSIGNFTPEQAAQILRNLRDHLTDTRDALLIGIDLAPCTFKSVETLLAAYNDAAGVTAEFNKNILARLNRELKANFRLECFDHKAIWNANQSRIEMHLVSKADQTVTVAGHPFHFAANETIHTENSYKFTERSLKALLEEGGFGHPHWFYDGQRTFAVALAHPA
jgi:L-histidine Nalpha-methyltransferase